MAFALDGKLSLDAREFVKGTDKARKAVDEIGDEFGKLPKDAKDSAKGVESEFGKLPDKGKGIGDKFGGSLGKAIVAGFSSIGVGALVAQNMQAAMDRDAGLKLLQGQFDLTEAEAAKSGKIAGDLYADGWGEGIRDVQQAVGLVSQRLAIENDQVLSTISEGVLAVSKTWGEDFDAIVRSTSQLMENDLAPNAEAALNLIVGAFQEGGNEAGDLLDTIDEYSQHWAALGLSGEDALNQVVHGLQNGQRDADKMADAVKEMRIRIVENSEPVREALENIGLDADEVVEAFLAGGPAAREAFLEVVGELKRVQDAGGDTQEAVAILGTQFEDMGGKALDSLLAVDGGLQDTTGNVRGLSETVEATDWEKFKRRGETAGVTIGGALVSGANKATDGYLAVGGAIEGIFRGGFHGSSGSSSLIDDFEMLDAAVQGFDRSLFDGLTTFDEVRDAALEHAEGVLSEADAIAFANEAAVEWNRTQAETVDATDKSTDRTDALGAALGTLDSELGAIRSNAPKAASGIDDLTESEDELRAAAQEVTEALNDQFDAMFAAADAGFALRDAERDHIATMAELRDRLNEGGASMRELQEIQDEAAQSAGAVADASVRVAEELAAQNGATFTATDEIDTWNESMLDSASTADGPLRAAIRKYIQDVNGISDAKTTELFALVDAGKLDEANELLADASATRETAIIANADTGQAEADLEHAARERSTRITAYYRQIGGPDAPTVRAAQGPRAHGGPTRPGIHQVAERGPELLHQDGKTFLISAGGGQVVPAAASPIGMSPVSNTTSATTNRFDITVHAGMGASGSQIGRELVEQIRRYERTAGPSRIGAR